MNCDPLDLLPPRLLIVDDERQIHASLKLRLAAIYQLDFAFEAKDALEKIRRHRFDLCFADIHMPKMDGLTFIEAAQRVDPALGFVVLSAFDTYDNLRRTIPLQVYEFIAKPLPDRVEFEARIPEWIERTRQRRRDQTLVRHADEIAIDRDTARLERDIELVTSENARDALRQTASLLTTVQAHLESATLHLAAQVRNEPSFAHLLRSLEQARKIADAAVTAAESFFDSSYGNRNESPAMPREVIPDAAEIAMRMVAAEQLSKSVDCPPVEAHLPIHGLSGVDFLLMMVTALGAALTCTPANTTVGLRCDSVARLDNPLKDVKYRSCFWLNRRHALLSRSGLVIRLTAGAAALSVTETEAWLHGHHAPLASIPAHGLIRGIQKCQGLLGVMVSPGSGHFGLVLALPV